MSDDQTPQAPENRISTPKEVEDLQSSFMESMKGVGRSQPYVAMPAEGHDVHGLWHCFGAAHRSGYATHAMALHWVLDRILGIQTQLIPHRHMDIDIDEFPEDRSETLFDWTRSAVGHGHLVFSSFPPEVSQVMSAIGPPLVPYIAFEGTTVSPMTRDLCNGDAFKQVWVVHPFVRDALVASGVDESRVKVAMPMLFGGPWEGMFRAPRSPAWSSEAFTFGAMGTWHERKGFHDLVRAYFQEFDRDEPVQLVIRTSTFGKRRTIRELKEFLTEEVAAIAKELGDDDFPASKKQPHLQFILGTDATDQEVIRWLGYLDCFVSSSYGEGLGIPHIWAKGQGVPLVSTGFGAVGEMLSSLQAQGGTDDEIIPHEEVPVHPEMYKIATMFDRDTRWGGYDPSDLGQAMRIQFSRGRRRDVVGADFVRERHSADAAAARVQELLPGLLDAQLLQDWGVT